MIRAFLRSKIHRATVTHVDIDYEGSLSLDEDLMKAAGLAPFERIDVYNVSNGERFSTYVIRGEKGPRQVGVFGAAGRKVKVGDVIIIAAYAYLQDSEIEFFTPKIVLMGEGNRIAGIR
ncbi:MAG: aspartate 1-decarboxylase [Candidatus Aminicenantes bacterium]|nr:aspartate 1-decarboxylase [Candidatus Aminicenantes bacterium]TFG58228.1 MAG: aspartate 1-decarboxylase [Candidatus Aminicenantes bacterium]